MQVLDMIKKRQSVRCYSNKLTPPGSFDLLEKDYFLFPVIQC
jgi:hypothetical protein